jgi:Tfp pilus assembly protein PilN
MKLNLVPNYVRQRKINKQVIALLVVLFVVVNALMVFWMVSVQDRLRGLQARKSELEAQAQQVDSLYSQANALIDSAAIALGKAEWVKRVQQHNLKYPELYSEVSRYTSPRVRYAGMQVVQGNQLQLSGFTKGIRELGLFLQTMYNCPLFTAVSLTSAALPSYPSGGGQAGMTAPGFSGFGGGAPAGPMIGGLTGTGGGSAPPPPPPPLSLPGGGFGGGFAGGGATQVGSSPANLMPFQVVAYLKEPITPPTPPASVPGLNLGGGAGMPTLGGFGGTPAAPPAALGGRGIGVDI